MCVVVWGKLPDLPDDNPFTPAIRWILAITLANFTLLLAVLWTKRQTQELLMFVKEWVMLGKGMRDDTLHRMDKVEDAARRTAAAVHELPDKVAEKTAVVVGAVVPPSTSGVLPVVPKEQT